MNRRKLFVALLAVGPLTTVRLVANGQGNGKGKGKNMSKGSEDKKDARGASSGPPPDNSGS